MTNIRIGLDTAKHVFPLPSLLAGGIYFFGRLARKAPGRRSMRRPRAAYSVIRRLRSGPPQWLNRRAGACPGLLGQPEHSIARHANHTG